jgi:hypothetical protein
MRLVILGGHRGLSGQCVLIVTDDGLTSKGAKKDTVFAIALQTSVVF